MKNLFICIIPLLFFASCSGAVAINEKSEEIRSAYPKFEEVLTYADKYVNSGCEECEFRFAKRPAGYYLEIFSTGNSPELIESIQVWDAASQEFQEINVDKHLRSIDSYLPPGASEEQRQEVKNKYNLNGFSRLKNREGQYDFHLYYGYSGWYQDLMDLLEDGGDDLSLENLENLARAYDFKANNYIHPGQWGDAPAYAKELTEGNYTKISADQLKEFETAAEKSLYYYDKIIEKDPDYMSFLIGHVQLKKGNNLMHYYNVMNSVREEELANKYLKRTSYPEGYVAMAKGYLDGCAKNALLFTNGDSDTFPLWYVQNALGYRKDVAVLNASLLSVPWYINMSKAQNDIDMRLNVDDCFNNEVSYFLLEENRNPTVLSVSEMLDVFNAYASSKHTDNTETIKCSKSFKLWYSGQDVAVNIKSSVMLLGDVAILDLIQNNPDRKTFFTSAYTLRNFGISQQDIKRLFTVELSPEKVREGVDSVSVRLVEEYINNINPKEFVSTGNMRSMVLYNIYSVLSHIKTVDSKKAETLFKILNKKLPDNLFYNNDGLSCLLNKYYLRAMVNSDELEASKNDFNETALNLITDLTKDNYKEKLQTYKDIYAIYASITTSLKYYGKEERNPAHIEIMQLIVDKIEKAEKQEIFKNLKWTEILYKDVKRDAKLFVGE